MSENKVRDCTDWDSLGLAKKPGGVDLINSIKEIPPQVIIDNPERINLGGSGISWKCELFNPGQVHDIATLGLAISQLGAIVATYNTQSDMYKSQTPMVFRIKKLTMTDESDVKTPDERLHVTVPDIKVNPRGISMIRGAKVKYGSTLVAESDMTLAFLSPKELAKSFDDRLIKPENDAETNNKLKEKLIGSVESKYTENLPDLSVPGFADKFILSSRKLNTETGDQVAFLETDPSIFEGHFPEAKIVPLAGSARPAFWMAMQDYRKKNPGVGNLSITSIENLSVPAAISPNGDFLSYELSPLSGSGEYSIIIHFFDKNGNKQVAAKFEKVVVEETFRQNDSWADPSTIEAFRSQVEIPEYQEHVQLMGKMIKKAIAVCCEDLAPLSIADIGTGSMGNMAIEALRSILDDFEFEEVGLHLSDVADQILSDAKKSIKNYLDNQSTLTVKTISVHTHTLSGVGEILNSREGGDQDVIFSNFALDYNDRETAISDVFSHLKSGGQAVLGFVKESPPYYEIFNTVVARALSDGKDLSPYYVMKYIGVLMDELDHAGIHSQSLYSSVDVLSQEIVSAGFEVVHLVDDSFAGIGCIFRLKKP